MSYTPYITKQIGRSTKLIDIPTEMLSQRIIFLGTAIDDYVANSIVQQLMWLATVSSEDIDLYIQSPGGSVYAGLSIADCINLLDKQGIKVNTIGTGMVASMGAYLLSAGTGVRKATKNCRIMVHSVSSGTGYSTVHDQRVHIKETEFLQKQLMLDIVNNSKGKLTIEELNAKSERDWHMSPDEAIQFGIIDVKI
mgnify:CR=1 FL=1